MGIGYLIGSIAIAIVILVLMLFVVTRLRRKWLVLTTIIFFSVGIISLTLIYSLSYFSTAQDMSIQEYFNYSLRAFFYAGKSFMGEDDYQSIETFLEGHNNLMGVFFASLIVSIVAAALAVFAMVGRELINKLRIKFGRYPERYIILGSSKKALILGENIAKRDNRKSAKIVHDRLIVFMADYVSKETRESIEDFDGILIEYSPDTFNKQIRLNAKKCAGKLIRLIAKICAGNKPIVCHLIIISETDADTLMLLRDAEEKIKDASEKAEIDRAWIDIHVMTDSLIIEKKIQQMSDDRSRKFNLHSFNEYELLLRSFLNEYPPYMIIKDRFDGGRCKKAFTVVIVGFGQSGELALRHLAMNSQFVLEPKQDDRMNGQFLADPEQDGRMKAILVDKEIDLLKDSFDRRYPEFYKCCYIEPKGIDVRSKAFYEIFSDKKDNDGGKNIDAIIINLGDDLLDLSILGEIVDQYSIVNDNAESHPLVAAMLKDGIAVIENGQDTIDFIPHNESIYSEQTVIRSDIDAMAKAVNFVYEGKPEKIDGKPVTQDTLWNELDKFDQDSNRAVADFLPAFVAIASKKTIAKNEDVKVLLKEVSESDNLLDYLKEKDGLTDIESEELRKILAETEHLRWCAFHYASGYRTMDNKEMEERAQTLVETCQKENKGGDEFAKYVKNCRKNKLAKKHALLIPTTKLDDFSYTYNTLMSKHGIEVDGNFRDKDKNIVTDIPDFLKSKANQAR